jgi:hypothetical protein
MKKSHLLDLYTDFLMTAPGAVSALVMSKMLQDAYSHDSITRMLAQDELDQSLFWKLIKPTIRQVESEDGVISVDDTIENKPYSDENELICWHFDHTVGKSVKGINIVTFNYSSQYEDLTMKLPVAFELVRKDKLVEKTEKKDGKFITRIVRQASISKIELVRNRLQTLVFQNQVKFKYVTFDTWYSDAGLITYIVKNLKKQVVCAIKDNRNVSFDIDKTAKERSWIAASEAKIEPEKTYQVYLKGIDFPVTLVKKVYNHLDGSSGVQFLVSTDTTLSSEQVTDVYKKRWASEELHRSLKQNTALEKMPAKMESSQANHIFASMIAQVKLEALRLATKVNHYTIKRNILIEALKVAWVQIQQLKQLCIDKNIKLPNFNIA